MNALLVVVLRGVFSIIEYARTASRRTYGIHFLSEAALVCTVA